MIDIFYAPDNLQHDITHAPNERALLVTIMNNIGHYYFATHVACKEMDIAFAAAGGQTRWINADQTEIELQPLPNRPVTFGDILIELPQGFINLATPAGFIPLVDLIYFQGQISRKRLN